VGIDGTANLRKNLEALNSPLDRDLLREVVTLLEPVRAERWTTGRAENS